MRKFSDTAARRIRWKCANDLIRHLLCPSLTIYKEDNLKDDGKEKQDRVEKLKKGITSSFRARNRARRTRGHEHVYTRSKRNGLNEHLLAQWGIKELEKNASELQIRIMHPHDETFAKVETTRCLGG